MSVYCVPCATNGAACEVEIDRDHWKAEAERALFLHGSFPLHSGGVSDFKIDCDALTVQDWQAFAAHIAPTLAPFRDVVGVPTGGNALAAALRPYATEGPTLIVDDVLTTGASMKEHRTADAQGLVLFARRMPPPWIRAGFVVGTEAERWRALAEELGAVLDKIATRCECGMSWIEMQYATDARSALRRLQAVREGQEGL